MTLSLVEARRSRSLVTRRRNFATTLRRFADALDGRNPAALQVTEGGETFPVIADRGVLVIVAKDGSAVTGFLDRDTLRTAACLLWHVSWRPDNEPVMDAVQRVCATPLMQRNLNGLSP